MLRFCRRLGLPGYPQLRLGLAEESAHPRSAAAADTDISAKDSHRRHHRQGRARSTRARSRRPPSSSTGRPSPATAAAVAAAERVDIYGIGASAIVGTDLQQKLHRIGVVAFAWNDPHIALTSATLLSAG